MKKKTIETLNTLEGEMKGKYYYLETISKDDQKQLLDDHVLFKDGDKFLRDASGYRFWPEGRGIFHDSSKIFLVWINEEAHLRFISMQQGGNVAEVYKRLVNAINQLEKNMNFCQEKWIWIPDFLSHKPGYNSPSQCLYKGAETCSRQPAQCQLCQVQSSAKRCLFKKDLTAFQYLTVPGIHGEHTESDTGVYDISNKRRLDKVRLRQSKK